MKMPIETISRSEYKKRNKLYSLPEVETYRLSSKKKGQSPRPPKEDQDTTVAENGNLNQTQMTDLPPDEVSVQNITAEDLPTDDAPTLNSTVNDVPSEDLPKEEGTDKHLPGDDTPAENSPAETLKCGNSTQDLQGDSSDQKLPSENQTPSDAHENSPAQKEPDNSSEAPHGDPPGNEIPNETPNQSPGESLAQEETNKEAKSNS